MSDTKGPPLWSLFAGGLVTALMAVTISNMEGHRSGYDRGREVERERLLEEAVERGYAENHGNGRYEWLSPDYPSACVPLEIHAELYWVDGSGWTVVGVRKNNHPCAPESCRTKESEK